MSTAPERTSASVTHADAEVLPSTSMTRGSWRSVTWPRYSSRIEW